MKDKTIVLPDKLAKLEKKFRMIDEKNSIALENDSEFVIVEEFSNVDGSVQTGFTINESKNDEDKEEIVYAEEVFEENIDEDDDIYAKVNKDRLIQKRYHRSPYEIGEEIDKAYSTHGYKAKIGLNLIASMNFSRLLYFPQGGNVIEKAKELFDTVSAGVFSAEKSEEEQTIKDLSSFIKALEFAKNNLNKQVFVLVPNLKSKEVFEFLKPVYTYIDSPETNTYVQSGGKSYIVSKNVFFVLTLQENEILSDISRRLLRYISVVTGDIERCERDAKPVNLIISNEELAMSLRESLERRILIESTWKKLDSLVDYINPTSGFVLQNKIVRRLENYSSCLLTSPVEEIEALDRTLAYNFFNEAIITKNAAGYLGTSDIFNMMDSIFGAEQLPLSRKVIKDYLSLFDKKGNRLDAQ